MTAEAEKARAEIAAWRTDDDYVFARLRIWTCGLPNLLSPSEAANVFLALSEFAFWSDLHEPYILYGLRQRWKQFSARSRKVIEKRLLHAQPPPGNVSGSRYADAYSKLSRLHWLSRSGVVFSFNLETCINALRLLAPKWTEPAGDAVADSHAPQVRGIAIDVTPDPLLETPIAEILRRAGEIGGPDFYRRVQREPFRGLADRHPVRALPSPPGVSWGSPHSHWGESRFSSVCPRSGHPMTWRGSAQLPVSLEITGCSVGTASFLRRADALRFRRPDWRNAGGGPKVINDSRERIENG
jgi:hypothetical protein